MVYEKVKIIIIICVSILSSLYAAESMPKGSLHALTGSSSMVESVEALMGDIGIYEIDTDLILREDGNTPLHLAASALQVDLVQALLAAGANKNSKNKFGLLPLHVACRGKSLPYFLGKTLQQMLLPESLKAADSIDSQDEDGNTCLHLSADQRCADSIRKLLPRGALQTIQNYEGYTPLEVADDEGIVRILLEFLDDDVEKIMGSEFIERMRVSGKLEMFLMIYEDVNRKKLGKPAREILPSDTH